MRDAAALGMSGLEPRIKALATSLPSATQRSQARHALAAFAPKKSAAKHPAPSRLQRLEERVRQLEK